jgi:hemerythrin-like domain-containing protein
MAGGTVHPTHNMNACIHRALRRDLERLDRVTAAPVPDEQRVAIGRQVPWMLDYLHHHHVGEDEGVWPRTLARRPDLQQLVDTMTTEHEALAAAADGLRAATAAWSLDGSDDRRAEMADAVGRMRDATLPHLEHEERDAMPLVVEALQPEDWEYLSRNHFRKGLSISDTGLAMMWILDDLDPEYAAVVRDEVPGPVLWVLTRIFGRRYDREAAAAWGAMAGTRA